MLVTMAKMFNSYAPFPLPVEPKRAGMEASGEFIAR
jgi:hypothetical protein